MEEKSENKKLRVVGIVGVGGAHLVMEALLHVRDVPVPDVVTLPDFNPAPKTMTREKAMASLENFAQSLQEMTLKEVRELAKILKDEYGICPKLAEEKMVFELRHQENDFIFFEKREIERPFVPKVIGQVNAKPQTLLKRYRRQ